MFPSDSQAEILEIQGPRASPDNQSQYKKRIVTRNLNRASAWVESIYNTIGVVAGFKPIHFKLKELHYVETSQYPNSSFTAFLHSSVFVKHPLTVAHRMVVGLYRPT